MASITLKGNPINSIGDLPAIGSKLKDFDLIKNDLSHVSLKDFKGKKLVLNIFLSLDTGTCATSVRTFNKEAANLEDTVVLCISRDLPFAHSRFCGAEGIENAITLSDFASGQFGKDYQLTVADSPLANLLSRSIIVADKDGNVTYTEQVAEITAEPNYGAAIEALKKA